MAALQPGHVIPLADGGDEMSYGFRAVALIFIWDC